ncbi:HNH endonuclease signature motif containing protein [Helicobacter cetorum]|uniref:HNH nuclease domain-containing protein n=1 Tax=Helicobacter cetorum (strain ATCC BAA-540 / CCUG 52418 / MIT 99-5656) TaxID=1163745 RepID=I0EUT8_HELCM|nr:HNH endonuclease signature motif containing protein [Helicobacter cetorum]AFI06707.1 hypothetical protein HCD_08635 [Helicobacter cetorum MIT 99-5656]
MPHSKKKAKIYRVDNFKDIQEIMMDKSPSLLDYMHKYKNSEYVLYYKMLSHSDLPTFAKAVSKNHLDKNLLYYLSTEQMQSIEKKEERNFEVAKQSNISLSKRFWKDLNMADPRVSIKDSSISKNINDYAKVYLVNNTLKDFNYKLTLEIFKKLNKIFDSKKFNANTMEIKILNHQAFTPLELHQAVHGIGTSKDREFVKLRHNMFRNDLLYFLIEKTNSDKNLFIMPFRNPLFFSLLGITNSSYQAYMDKRLKIENNQAVKNATFFEKESMQRQHQNKWRKNLALEMMNYATTDRAVVCPLTWIEADFDDIGTLFKASHIKGYSECKENEKYDINNGLLLVANADALFDKHLITIDENKQLKFSYLLNNNHQLKSKLHLNNDILKEILNENRMAYLKHHRAVFEKEEQKRKTKKSDFNLTMFF